MFPSLDIYVLFLKIILKFISFPPKFLLHNFFVFSAIVQPPRHQNKPCGVHLSFEIAVIQNNNGPISGQSISQIKWYIFVAWTGITDCKNQYYQMKMYDNFSRNKLMYNNNVDNFITSSQGSTLKYLTLWENHLHGTWCHIRISRIEQLNKSSY